jgi:hypothetical protein
VTFAATIEERAAEVAQRQDRRWLALLLLRELEERLPDVERCRLALELHPAGLAEVSAALVRLDVAIEKARAALAREED